MTKNNLEHKNFSRRGGLTTFKRHGREFYKNIGKKGARANLKKYGTDYYKELSKKAVAARQAKIEASKPLIEKVVDAIIPPSDPEKTDS